LLGFFRFIGEESVAAGEKCELTEKKTWIIDPIDGTTNFISSNPQICTILGFMVDKEVQFGIVYNPILDQLWTARKGQGAEYNGSKVALLLVVKDTLLLTIIYPDPGIFLP
jgi:myo-inositol-1(or 4)-monophosphatase